ncbi:MAG: metallophosphoesterase [Deltaproteobacteria bacterium]|nr:MAG: metallophosphoesterase [Deltaproteobacteria bacterium]
MSLFLLTFLSVYGALHLYLFVKARSAFAAGVGTSVAIALFLTAMVVGPIAVRLLDRHGMHLAGRYLAYLTYTWMGLLFFFFWLSLCLDVYNLSMKVLALLPGFSTDSLVWKGRDSFTFIILGVVFLGGFSGYSAWQIRLERVVLQTMKLPAQMEKLTIAQISDVHLGPMVGERRLARIIRLLERAKPDLVVATGDLVDAQMDRLNNLAAMLATLDPPLGKFAVAGNHEFYAGIRQSGRFLRTAGFNFLRNEGFSLNGLISIVGVDDPAGKRRYPENSVVGKEEKILLADSDPEKFTLLLKHRPRVEEESIGRFDLQLSGHTHGGQVFPFNLITRLFYSRQRGLHRLDRGSVLYASRGTGTWGPPMRFLSPPEVTLIELKRVGN